MKAKNRGLVGYKGETGIGTLIIFIAVVLVAAIAASVLLGTSGSLQQRALTTGKQTEREVSGGVEVITVSATNGSDGSLDTFEMLVKLSAGSDPVSFDDLLITFDSKDASQRLSYNPITTANDSSSSFNISYAKVGPEYKVGYMNKGDVISIMWNASSPVAESELIRIRLIPKYGIIIPIQFVTPDVITQQRVMLYP